MCAGSGSKPHAVFNCRCFEFPSFLTSHPASEFVKTYECDPLGMLPLYCRASKASFASPRVRVAALCLCSLVCCSVRAKITLASTATSSCSKTQGGGCGSQNTHTEFQYYGQGPEVRTILCGDTDQPACADGQVCSHHTSTTNTDTALPPGAAEHPPHPCT